MSAETKKPKGWLMQFVAFNLVGLVNTAVDFLLFQALVWLGVFYIGAQIISYAAGTLNSYVMNRAFTFKKRRADGGGGTTQALRFFALNLGVLLFSLALLYALADLGGLPYWLSKLLVTAVTVVFNFVGSKRWVFRERRSGSGESI